MPTDAWAWLVTAALISWGTARLIIWQIQEWYPERLTKGEALYQKVLLGLLGFILIIIGFGK
jgi:hypothetical protein